MRFDELLKMVPSSGTATLPKANRLPDSNVLITKDMGDGIITVYENGLYTFSAGKRVTVYAVDRCANYIDPVDPQQTKIPYERLAEMEWFFPLWMMGLSRMENNMNRLDEEHTAYSLNNDGSDYSVFAPSTEEILSEKEEEREEAEKMQARKNVLSEVMNSLSDIQKATIHEAFYNNKSRTEIARERGCSQQAVSKNVDAALKKAKKMYNKKGIK